MGMLPGKLFELTRHLSCILHDLEEAGIRVEMGDNFAKYRAYRGRTRIEARSIQCLM